MKQTLCTIISNNILLEEETGGLKEKLTKITDELPRRRSSAPNELVHPSILPNSNWQNPSCIESPKTGGKNH